MKSIITMICLMLATPSFAEEHDKGKNLEEYDSNMKSAGKWSFISNFMFLTSVAGLGTTYYALDKMKPYADSNMDAKPGLTPEEQKKYDKYNKMAQQGAGVAVGGFLFGVIGYGAQVIYERDAYSHALKVGIEF